MACCAQILLLPYHFSIILNITRRSLHCIDCHIWSPGRELNPRPHPYQGCALPLSYLGLLTCPSRQMERVAGIEPASSAWKAEVLPLYHARFNRKTLRGESSSVLNWWRGLDSNQRRLSQQIYSLPPLATREPLHFNLLHYPA